MRTQPRKGGKNLNLFPELINFEFVKITLSIVITTLVTGICNSQGLTQHEFFVAENENLIWQKVYERPAVSADSISRIIYNNVKLDNTLQLVSENESEVVMQMNKKMFVKNGDFYFGKLIIEFKDEKYRITLTGVSRDMGTKTLNTASILLGVNNGMKNFNGLTWESDYLNKKGFIKQGGTLRALTLINGWLTKEFDYYPSKLKDW